MSKSEVPVIVDVILPCLDERDALPWVLSRLPQGYRAIVVDNGSTDGSADVAAELGAMVIREPVRGFGSAAHAGLRAATADYVAFCDCDGSMDPAALPGLMALVLDGTADLVMGSRRPKRRSWPLHARIANLVLAWRLRRLTGEKVTDLGPMRCAGREALLSLNLLDRRSGYPLEMFLKASQRHWRISELPINYSPRTGKSKVTGTVRGTLTAVMDMSAQLRSARLLSSAAPVQSVRGNEEEE
ncbi:glycosyltransferase family 2 protein [Arthrobacter sp. A5]|uniref:glycosyltransferase family 2 protein n=1 Tax=Arthrobacter sp. A5 TaxID=576926 RepID=UPI003DA93B29